MSARSQRGIKDAPTTKRFRSPKNRAPKQQITYDYDAAISQPDVPNLLNCKRIGRGAMVSAPIKKRTVKPRLKGQVTSSKSFQRKFQELRAKQKNTRELLSVSKNTSDEKKTNAPKGILEEEKQVAVKENVTSNGDVDNSSNRLGKNLTMNSENILSKDVTEETNVVDNEDPVAQEEIKDDDCESVTKSTGPVKGSKIPRARNNVFPVHTYFEFQPEKKVLANKLRCPLANSAIDKIENQEQDGRKRSCKDEPNSCRQEVVRFEELQNETKIVWNRAETSTLEADEEGEDRGSTSADESPGIISSIDDPRVLNILRSLKLNCPCKSCNEQDPLSSSRQEDDSDLKSSSPEENRKKKSLKHRKYADSSSENVEISSDCNNENMKKKKSRRRSILTRRIKTNSVVNMSPKISNHRRSSFSFFNTLFDIVFWPYLFLKTNR